MPTFRLETFEDANVSSHVQSHKRAHVSGAYCHAHVSSVRGCAFVCLTAVYERGGPGSLVQAQAVQNHA